MPHTFEFCSRDSDYGNKVVQLNLWKNAANLKTLFGLNKLHISGQLTVHPAHDIPLYAESASLKQELLELNEYGHFTFQGQPRTEPGEEELMGPHAHDQVESIEPTETRA
jgi:hypothetical protein